MLSKSFEISVSESPDRGPSLARQISAVQNHTPVSVSLILSHLVISNRQLSTVIAFPFPMKNPLALSFIHENATFVSVPEAPASESLGNPPLSRYLQSKRKTNGIYCSSFALSILRIHPSATLCSLEQRGESPSTILPPLLPWVRVFGEWIQVL